MKMSVDEDDTVMIMSFKLCLLDIKNWQQQMQMLDVQMLLWTAKMLWKLADQLLEFASLEICWIRSTLLHNQASVYYSWVKNM